MSEQQTRAGLWCPGCGELAAAAVADIAFCGNDSCRWILWHPGQELAEARANTTIVDLPPPPGREL